MSQLYNYLPIDQISIGEKSIEEITALIGKERLKDTVIVTNNSVSQNGFFKKTSEMLAESRVYNTITQHSPVEEIDSIANDIHGKSVKFIVSVGGGSVIDASKVLRSKIGIQIPQIAVPTTLSAAEFSHIAGYTENGEKKGIRDKALVPRYIFLDPNATLETPTALWRSTGIRAIDHAIEATLGDGLIDLRVSFSTMALDKMLENLEGNWTDHRKECQIASWYSYMDVYDSPMGYSHLIGKVIGAKWGIPHGITSCITLPEMLRYYSMTSPGGLAKLASAIMKENDPSTAIAGLADRIEAFIKEMDLSRKLSDFGVRAEDLTYIADKLGQKDEAFLEHLRNIL